MNNIQDSNTVYFLLTVDTEEEWNWASDFPTAPFSTKNIEQLPAFQRFCIELGIEPTYFINYAVADNHQHINILKDLWMAGNCDFGAHMHPWVTPPLHETVNEKNSHAINLPVELFEKKLHSLTSKLQHIFDEHPYSFRAGRWGINTAQLQVLQNEGYRVDSSIRPYYRDTYFDYSTAPTLPYWPSQNDALSENDNTKGIMEIPATSGFTHTNFELLDLLHSKLSTPPMHHLRLIAILWRLALLRAVSVTPEGTHYRDVCDCIDASIKRGNNVINMFIHSSDLLPGNTPYVQSEKDKEKMMDSISRIVKHMRKNYSVTFTTMRQIRLQLSGES